MSIALELVKKIRGFFGFTFEEVDLASGIHVTLGYDHDNVLQIFYLSHKSRATRIDFLGDVNSYVKFAVDDPYWDMALKFATDRDEKSLPHDFRYAEKFDCLLWELDGTYCSFPVSDVFKIDSIIQERI